MKDRVRGSIKGGYIIGEEEKKRVIQGKDKKKRGEEKKMKMI